jgi:hypothetical protein
MAYISLLTALVLCFVEMIRGDYILCSGYVNTLESNIHPDLSKIKIAMYRDGILKETTMCNPDGSFVISVDESQNTPFSIEVKAPADATFDILSQIIDPQENITLCDAKINFVFQGFTISAQVIGMFSNIGPMGFPLELTLPDGKVVKRTRTERDGYYKFTNVYPGDYIIKAGSTTDFLVNKDSQSFTCKVDWTSTDDCASNVIIISGYFIKGTITKHLVGVVLAVYTKTKRIADELKTPKAKELADKLPKINDYHLLDAIEIKEPVTCI